MYDKNTYVQSKCRASRIDWPSKWAPSSCVELRLTAPASGVKDQGVVGRNITFKAVICITSPSPLFKILSSAINMSSVYGTDLHKLE
jgi:hypothetical protein